MLTGFGNSIFGKISFINFCKKNKDKNKPK